MVTPRPSAAAEASPRRDPGRALLAALALYFVAQAALRVALGGGVEKDEAEQLLWTQSLAWGYGHQPPLYTWLQWAVFQATGPSLLGLALLKNALLFATYACTWAAARRLLAPAPAALAAACLLLLPQIAWESQRDLTHTVLVTAAAAATLWAAIALLQRPATARYLALGVAIAAGTLAKYSYVLVPLALAGAALADRRLRGALLDRRLLVTVAVAAALVTPHALWLAAHWHDATTTTAGKLALQPAGAPQHLLRGLGSLALAVLGFLTPLWLVFAALFGRGLWRERHAAPPSGPWAAFLPRYLALLGAALVLLALAGAGQFKDRWMQPLLFCAPLAFLAARPALATPRRTAALRRLLLATAALLLLGMALRAPLAGRQGRPGDLNLPLAALAEALRTRGVQPDAIVADNARLAAGLRLVFPGARVSRAPDAPPAGARRLLLIASPPERFDALRALDPAWAGLEAARLELPWRFGGSSARPAAFAYALLPARPEAPAP
jgi:4-amino-4-deoxy-L-arabinose transferase-like glycosyltransferase